MMIPCPTTLETLSEVNHQEVLSWNLSSTLINPIQRAESGTQANYYMTTERQVFAMNNLVFFIS